MSPKSQDKIAPPSAGFDVNTGGGYAVSFFILIMLPFGLLASSRIIR